MGTYGKMAALSFTALALGFFYFHTNAAIRFEIGNHYFGEGAYDIEKALYHYSRANALDSALPGLHYQLARVHFIKSEFKTALEEIEREIELYPDYKRSYYVRGLIRGYNGEYQGAAADFQEFLKWKEDSWAGWNDLAWVYFRKGDYASAYEAASAGLAYHPYNPWLLNSAGVALLNLGKRTEAKEVFERSKAILGKFTPADWGKAYPGNDPFVYREGLEEMRTAVAKNLELLK